jgi:hypothetical protein
MKFGGQNLSKCSRIILRVPAQLVSLILNANGFGVCVLHARGKLARRGSASSSDRRAKQIPREALKNTYEDFR